MSHKLGHLSRIFAVEINKTRCYDIKRITRLAFVRRNCTFPHKALSYDYAPRDFFVDLLPKIFCPRLDNTLGKEIRIDVAYYE